MCILELLICIEGIVKLFKRYSSCLFCFVRVFVVIWGLGFWGKFMFRFHVGFVCLRLVVFVRMFMVVCLMLIFVFKRF